ncbi:MAG: LON peptidase substrate-binding domain-containing protein [Actinomycetota bacterium]|nr:LON peptidase substrate-binding domain-containing protein [Actinomycetota bacterium]
MAVLLPLFPLGHVLLPGSPLPLRVFEERYRQLMQDVAGDGGDRRFGVVALSAGLEVRSALTAGEQEFARIGTVAEIMEAQLTADGAGALVAVGSQRFRINRIIDAGKLYLQADVDYLDEPVGELPDTLPDSARALAIEYARLLSRLTGVQPETEPYPSDPAVLSYRIALEAPLDPADRQVLLEQETAAERLHRLVRLLRREVVLLRQTRTIAVAPSVLFAALRAH